mmetsp:Transcript_59853/g.120134  ORF Transcript_59853/g.120134 Transcript_59853/m.120134 type:complete len:230 (-) Transcript_59853:302-991(-)
MSASALCASRASCGGARERRGQEVLELVREAANHPPPPRVAFGRPKEQKHLEEKHDGGEGDAEVSKRHHRRRVVAERCVESRPRATGSGGEEEVQVTGTAHHHHAHQSPPQSAVRAVQQHPAIRQRRRRRWIQGRRRWCPTASSSSDNKTATIAATTVRGGGAGRYEWVERGRCGGERRCAVASGVAIVADCRSLGIVVIAHPFAAKFETHVRLGACELRSQDKDGDPF